MMLTPRFASNIFSGGITRARHGEERRPHAREPFRKNGEHMVTGNMKPSKPRTIGNVIRHTIG